MDDTTTVAVDGARARLDEWVNDDRAARPGDLPSRLLEFYGSDKGGWQIKVTVHRDQAKGRSHTYVVESPAIRNTMDEAAAYCIDHLLVAGFDVS